WVDITLLISLKSLPIFLNGILRCDVAKEAVKHGVDGILVSNHGARQLDGVPATIDVLPEIVEAVEGKVEVFLDGGSGKAKASFAIMLFSLRNVMVQGWW
ncbi:alpha-hydroxy-acid oxidizing protein, partial [Vibrio parahaemolyticus]|nr:alpha-hydroxy-acid oxidizing protein [Vibrio parahaemolyticus]